MLGLFIILPLVIVIGFVSDFYLYQRFLKNRLTRILFLTKSLLLQLGILVVVSDVMFRREWLPYEVIMWLFVSYIMFYVPQMLFMLLSLCDFKRRFIKYDLVIAFMVFGFMFYGVTFGRLVPRVELCELSFERLPESFKGYKIVQMSDIHLGNLSNGHYLVERLVDEVNALNPDIIVFTGDLVNFRANEVLPYKDILSQFKAKDGVYSILGNHDYGDYVKWGSVDEKTANLKELKQLQPELGWNLLNNENRVIHRGDDSIAIIGVENWGLSPFPAHGDLNKATEGLDCETFKLLLSHDPTHWDEATLKRKDIDLTLSGHTHAMQMKFSFFNTSYSPASHLYNRWSGLYREGEQYLYVNEGVGCVGVPMRRGTRPEITLIVLK